MNETQSIPAQPAFPLSLLPQVFAVVRLRPDAPVPVWALKAGMSFACVTVTPDEVSVVCEEALVPAGHRVVERGWRALKLEGPVPFTTTGIVSGLTSPLAAAGLSVFVVSTYDTDYLLVKAATLDRVVETLRGAGFVVNG